MRQILLTVTRTSQRLRDPRPLPVVTEKEAREFFRGWWHALPLGFVCGVAVGVMAAGVIK